VEEFETRFGFIYATFSTIGQASGQALVSVYIDDATRRPHLFGTYTVALADQSPEALTVALAAATERMGRDYGVTGMTWLPSYVGWKGCQWHPDTAKPVNGRAGRGSIRVPAVPRRRHARTGAR
jgi:hypothetical protein